jgi:hypothetical protein
MKCLSIDLDGTLLNTSHGISTENLEAIKEAKRNGVHVILNTGRDLPEVLCYPELKNLNVPVICMNGTRIFTEKNELLFEVQLPKDLYFVAMNLLTKHNVKAVTFTNKGMFTQENSNIPEFYDESNVIRTNFEKLVLMDDIIFYKILINSDDTNLLKKIQSEIIENTKINASFSYFNWMEVTGPGATKGKALKQYEKLRGNNFTEIYSIGDGGNDVSKFKISTISVAMGNAPEDIKAAANFVTKTTDENGVAYAIKHLFKLI